MCLFLSHPSLLLSPPSPPNVIRYYTHSILIQLLIWPTRGWHLINHFHILPKLTTWVSSLRITFAKPVGPNEQKKEPRENTSRCNDHSSHCIYGPGIDILPVSPLKCRATTQMRNSIRALKIAQNHITGEWRAGSQTSASSTQALLSPPSSTAPILGLWRDFQPVGRLSMFYFKHQQCNQLYFVPM